MTFSFYSVLTAYAADSSARYEGDTKVTARVEPPPSSTPDVPDEPSGTSGNGSNSGSTTGTRGRNVKTGDSSHTELRAMFVLLVLSSACMFALAFKKDRNKGA